MYASASEGFRTSHPKLRRRKEIVIEVRVRMTTRGGFWENGKRGRSGIVVSLRLLLQGPGEYWRIEQKKNVYRIKRSVGDWGGVGGDIIVRVSMIKAQSGSL
jgi:hypothetical protein